MKLTRLTLFGVLVCLSTQLPSFGQATLAFSFPGNVLQQHQGESVAGAGDVNADGYPDIIVGAPGFYYQAVNPSFGVARIYSGFDGSFIRQINALVGGTTFGFAVDGVGDVNNDGYDDVFVGSPTDNTIATNSGRADVFSGFDGSLLYSFFGPTAGSQLGFSVSGAGDINGDGIPDMIAGAPFFGPANSQRGAIRVYSGFDGTIIHTVAGANIGDNFGTDVGACGDVNGDGRADFIAGAPKSGGTFGSARVFSGIDKSVIHTIAGLPNSHLGRSVCGIGDIDRDGLDDFAIGIPDRDFVSPVVGPGKVQVYSGATGLVLFGSIGQMQHGSFGFRMDRAGDVNGDGYDDLIVGAPLRNNHEGSAAVISGKDGSRLHTFTTTLVQTNVGISVCGVGDIDLDGFADIAYGASAESSAVGTHTGAVHVYTAPTLPALNYDTEIGADTQLYLDWDPTGGNQAALTGTLSCTGATPGAFGLYGTSFAPASLVAFGIPLLIAVDPTNFVDSGTFGFGFSGELVIPGVSRQNPFVAGSFIHIQMYETSPTIRSSNGIRLFIEP